jgi:hypothetical protein
VGLAAVGGLTEIPAGVLGTAATWVASTGAGVAVWGGGAVQTQRLTEPVGGRPVFFGGGDKLRCLAPPKKKAHGPWLLMRIDSYA